MVLDVDGVSCHIRGGAMHVMSGWSSSFRMCAWVSAPSVNFDTAYTHHLQRFDELNVLRCAAERCCLEEHQPKRLRSRPSDAEHTDALHPRKHLVKRCDLERRHQNCRKEQTCGEEQDSQAEWVGEEA